MRLKRIFILLTLFMSFEIVQAESSLFGLSKREVVSAQLSDSNRDEIILLKQRVRELTERVDGLTTVIEDLYSKINDSQRSQRSQQSDTNDREIELLKGEIKALRSECISRREPAEMRSEKRAKVPSQDTANLKSAKVEKNQTTIYREGVQLFQKHQYDEAQKRFSMTASKGYKPAASNYYLGEISYYTKSYSDAIYYFKKSAGLYDKASYMDTLLLHTAISLDRSGDKSQAKLFYKTIINDYPEKKSAKIAKKNLNKL
ncbi:MAG: hypothetical protein U9R27_06145 [Campylobacterota bacterium]|nr:hypothetical protein [Campylobacterota bacterium]